MKMKRNVDELIKELDPDNQLTLSNYSNSEIRRIYTSVKANSDEGGYKVSQVNKMGTKKAANIDVLLKNEAGEEKTVTIEQ